MKLGELVAPNRARSRLWQTGAYSLLLLFSYCREPATMPSIGTSVLHFSGHQHLRHRLILSIISGKPVKIDKIRSDDKNPGLRGMS